MIKHERINVESVGSPIVGGLGVDIGALAPVDRHVEGVVEMVMCPSESYWLMRGTVMRRRLAMN